MNTRPARRVPRALQFLALAVALLAVAELACRGILGLGTPPLYEADAGFEYRLHPNQDLQRFGNHVFVNRWGMRAPDFEAHKAVAGELRVMVMGDSVVNGGSQIDQANLSTALLQARLQAELGGPVTVGNISAGSWGPGNWLAYAQRFGFFDADVVALVLGGGDQADNPSFAPLGINHPTQAPLLAIEEAVQRYLPRYLPEPLRTAWSSHPEGAPAPVQPDAQASARGLADLEAFLRLAVADGRSVVVLYHPDRDEMLSGRSIDGHDQIRMLVQRLSLPFIDLRTPYQLAGPSIYRDNIHHSAQGQQVMADALHAAVATSLVQARSKHHPLSQRGSL